jgi:hypothetical protein
MKQGVGVKALQLACSAAMWLCVMLSTRGS